MLPSRGPNRTSFLLALFIVSIACVWVLFSRSLVPLIIQRAYYGQSWSVFNHMIRGQAHHSLEEYLTGWNALSSRALLTFFVGAFLLVLVIRPEIQIHLGSVASRGTGKTGGETESGRRSPTAIHFLPSRRATWIFGAIVFVAALLRVIFLSSKSLFQDEMASLSFGTDSWGNLWKILLRKEANMSLYYVFLHFWLAFGSSESAIRSLSVIFALATLPVLYALGTRLFGEKVGLLTAFLFAISGFDIEYSQDARSYSLVVLLVALSSLFFVKCVDRGSRPDWFGYVAFSSLAVYAHLFAVLVLLAQWSSLPLLRHRRLPWQKWFAAGFAIGIIDFPMALFVLFRDNGQLDWVPRMTGASIYHLFACFSGYADLLHLRGNGPLILTVLFSFMLVLLSMAAARKSFAVSASSERWCALFLLVWFVLPILVTLAVSFRTPVLVDRFLLICLPPFLLASAFCLSRVRSAWMLTALLVVIVGFTARGLISYYESPGVQDWRSATHYVLANAMPDNAVVFDPPYLSAEFAYYRSELVRNGAAPRSGPASLTLRLEEAPPSVFSVLLRTYRRVWLIGYLNPPRRLAREQNLIRAELKREYPRTRTSIFPGVLVVSYSRKWGRQD